MKQAFLVVMLLGLGSSLIAQDNPESKSESDASTSYRYTPSPDFPGALVFDWGINYFDGNSGTMDTKPWSSPTINVYYMYDHRLGSSRFSVNFGAGIGSEKHTFNSAVTFTDSLKITIVQPIDSIPFFATTSSVSKSQMVMNYIDIPLEFRIHSRKNDHKRSFYLALGGKIGFRMAGKTKVVYEEFGTTKKFKDLYHYHVNAVRYGASARIGYGPFNFWGYYGFNKYFTGNKTEGINNPNTFSFGVSLSTF